MPNLFGGVPRIVRHNQGAIEEDLLCLGLGEAMAPPALFRVPLVPLYNAGDPLQTSKGTANCIAGLGALAFSPNRSLLRPDKRSESA